MVRQMAADTRKSAHILRAMHMRRLNAPPDALGDNRINNVNALAQPFVEDRQAEQEQLRQERIFRMRQEIDQEIGRDSDLAARMSGLLISAPPPTTALIPPVPPLLAASITTDPPKTLISECMKRPQTLQPQ